MTRLALAALLALAAAPQALAADYETTAPAAAPVSTTDIVIELGIGGRIQPEYEASKDYEVSPFPIIGLDYLSIPGLFTIGSLDPQVGGFSIGPSFDYTSKRKSDDHDELRGLFDVDATYQAGIKASYEWTYVEVYGSLRYAFGGGEGLVGDVGANLIARPTPELELKAGPTVSFASEDYMESYFGVTPFESARTGGRLSAYDPDGGIKSAGVLAVARYEFRPDWFLNADASWNRFVGDAEDSPIVKVGNEDQFTFGLGVSKRFSLDLF